MMPSTSAKQAKFMRAVAHSPKFAKKVGVSQSVGKDFEMADKRKKMKKFSEGGEAARSAKINKRYDRKVADIKGDYEKALAKGKDAAVAKAKYEQRMADAADDRAKWTGGDRTQTRAAEKAAEKNLSMTRKYGPRSSDTQVAKAEEKLASKAPLSSVDTSELNKPKTTSFKEAFRAAREKGLKVFPWNGKSYTTQLAGQSASRPANKTPAPKPASDSGAARQTYANIMAKNFADREKGPKPAAGSTSAKAAEAPKRDLNRPDKAPVYAVNPLYPDRVTGVRTPRTAVDRLLAMKSDRSGPGAAFASEAGRMKDLYKAKGGKVKKYNKGGSTTDPRRAVLGSDKDIIARGNRTPYEPIPKTGPDKPKSKPLGRAGKAGFKSGGSVMKKSDKAGRALVKKSADTMGRAMKMNKGGKCYAKGGSIDGIAKKGKTRCKGAK